MNKSITTISKNIKRAFSVCVVAIFTASFVIQAITGNAATANDAVYRLYNGKAHFYTASVAEKNKAVSIGYRYEGVAWYLSKNPTVYRLFNGKAHFYTASVAEKNKAVASHRYKYEGVAWSRYSNPTVYRLYNGKDRFYTTSLNERNGAVSRHGYRYEGVAWTNRTSSLKVPAPSLTLTKTYDGNTTSSSCTPGTLSRLDAGHKNVTVTCVATYDNANVGTGKTITVVYTLAGTDAAKYKKPVSYQVHTGVITAKQLTVADPTLTLSKSYDGDTTSSSCTPGTLSGKVGSEDVTVTCEATYDNENVGTGKTITVAYTLGGTDAANYEKPTDYSVTTGEIVAAEVADITGADVSITQGSIIFGYTFMSAEGPVTYGDAKLAPYYLDEDASTVILTDGVDSTTAVSVGNLGITDDGTVEYTDIADVLSYFPDLYFMPTQVVIHLQGATDVNGGADAWTMAPDVTVDLDPAEMALFITQVESITVSSEGDVSEIENGATLNMSATVLPINASDSSVDWTVTDGSGSATIESTGAATATLTATGAGTVTVTATAHDGSGIYGEMVITINDELAPIYASTDALTNPTVSVAYGTPEIGAIGALDTTVGVVGSLGEPDTATIAWTIASYDGNTAGDYTATGVLTLPLGWTGGPAEDVTATVTVEAMPDVEITGFVEIEDLPAGTAGEAAGLAAVQSALPTDVTANEGAIVPVDSWADTDNYDPETAGSYTFTATLGSIPAGYANTGGFTATVEVVVAPSSDATVTAGTYTVSAVGGGFETITDVPFGTSKAVFLADLTLAAGATWDDTGIADPVVSTNVLVVTAEDGITTTVYTVTVDAAPSSDATVTAGTYTVSAVGGGFETITDVPFGTSKADFLADLTLAAGATWDDTGIADPVVSTNVLVVTAEDGITTTVYAITVE